MNQDGGIPFVVWKAAQKREYASMEPAEVLLAYNARLGRLRAAENDRAAADSAHALLESELDTYDDRQLFLPGNSNDGARDAAAAFVTAVHAYDKRVEAATSDFNTVARFMAAHAESDAQILHEMEKNFAPFKLPPLKYLAPGGAPNEPILPNNVESSAARLQKLDAERELNKSLVDVAYQAYKEADIKAAALAAKNSLPADRLDPARAKEQRAQVAEVARFAKKAYKSKREAFDRLEARRAQERTRLQEIARRARLLVKYANIGDQGDELRTAYARFVTEQADRKQTAPPVEAQRYKEPPFEGTVKAGYDNFDANLSKCLGRELELRRRNDELTAALETRADPQFVMTPDTDTDVEVPRGSTGDADQFVTTPYTDAEVPRGSMGEFVTAAPFDAMKAKIVDSEDRNPSGTIAAVWRGELDQPDDPWTANVDIPPASSMIHQLPPPKVHGVPQRDRPAVKFSKETDLNERNPVSRLSQKIHQYSPEPLSQPGVNEAYEPFVPPLYVAKRYSSRGNAVPLGERIEDLSPTAREILESQPRVHVGPLPKVRERSEAGPVELEDGSLDLDANATELPGGTPKTLPRKRKEWFTVQPLPREQLMRGGRRTCLTAVPMLLVVLGASIVGSLA